jgi:uncharacterized protein YjbI with pentapeptide repeats
MVAPNESTPTEDKGIDFRDRDLRGRDFSNESLRNADFSGADLRNCKFQNTDLTGANFQGATNNRDCFTTVFLVTVERNQRSNSSYSRIGGRFAASNRRN